MAVYADYKIMFVNNNCTLCVRLADCVFRVQQMCVRHVSEARMGDNFFFFTGLVCTLHIHVSRTPTKGVESEVTSIQF